MKKLFLFLIITVFVFTACLQADKGEKLLEYFPMQEDMQSHGFSINDIEQLIVVIYGGTFIPVLNQTYFQLTRKGQIVDLPAPVRNNNTRVTFNFDTPPENGDGYIITVKAAAIHPEDFTRKLIIQTVSGTEN